MSVRQAVNFARSTNLLGVILEASTLVSRACLPDPRLVIVLMYGLPCCVFQARVPSLVASVKDVGLLLATFGASGDVGALRVGAADGRTVDAFVIDG